MPSIALTVWTADRMARLAAVDGQAAASAAAVPPDPRLVDENRRGYALLMSAHFQGCCRDLHTECATIVASKVRPRLRAVVLDQFTAHRRLDHGNPTLENVEQDFNRFAFDLRSVLRADPANAARLADLVCLNKWRNAAAHRGPPPSGVGPLALADLRAWRGSCDRLAAALDGIMYTPLRRLLRRAPW